MPASSPAPSFARTTKVIAVADVVESVRLMEQDEQSFIGRWQRFVAFVQQRLRADSGRLHKSLGDGLMLEFSDAEGCLRAALAMRAWFADANAGLAPEDQVQLRIGAHVAEFVADEYDIYGTDVNLAARIASLAGPGEIVVSAALREQLGPSWLGQLEDLGACHLKHVKEPVHAFRLGRAGNAPVMPMRRFATHSVRPTVAVLPFAIDGAAAGELTGEALADEIVAALAGSDFLQVVSRLSTAPLAAAGASLDELRRTLGAHYVLTGRGQRHGSELSLFVELAHASSGHVAWAHSFRTPLREAVPGDARLMREVVAAVHAAVIAHATDRSRGQPLPALEGHTLLLASIALMHWLSAAETQRAREMLEHLVDRGRGHLAPHAWLAHLHVLALRQDGTDAGARQHARESAALAVQCDPAAPLALCMQGQACAHSDGDLAAAAECYAQALAERPQDSLALLLQGELLALQGCGTAALQAVHRAGDLFTIEPMRWLYDSIGALAALAAGEATVAATLARHATRRNPRFLPALRTLAVAQVRGGELPQARQTVQRLAARDPSLSVRKAVAAWPATSGLTQLFAQALREAGVPD